MKFDGSLPIHESMVFKLNHKKSPEGVQLRPSEWGIVTQLNGERSVAQIGEILSLNSQEVSEMFGHLLKEGLLELVEAAEDKSEYVPNSLFQYIESQLTYYMGPVSTFVLEEILEELKRTPATLQIKQLPLLIEFLSMEISSEEKKAAFQKTMLKKIKGIV